MKLDELRKIAEARTKGEWKAKFLFTDAIKNKDAGTICIPNTSEVLIWYDDSKFIAISANHFDAFLRLLEAAKVTSDAIYKMKDGMVYANSELGRILHSAPNLKQAIADVEGVE